MKQSVPWSVKGVEADARETAKELARRSGMTLGQWLNAMIAEQTGDNADNDQPDHQHGSPLETLADRLETMNRRASETAPPRPQADSAEDRVRDSEARTAHLLEVLFRRNAEAEARTEKMIEGLAKANKAIENKTANALAAVAKWIEAAERSPRSPVVSKAAERQTAEAVKGIAAKLDQIEARLPPDAATKPIKAAIDSLEARLAALVETSGTQRIAPDELTRTAADLERRLAAMADHLDANRQAQRPAGATDKAALQAGSGEQRAKSSQSAAASQVLAGPALSGPPQSGTGGGAPGADLLVAIDQIGARQRMLDGDAPGSPGWPPKPRGADDGAERRARNEIEVQIANLTREIAAMRQLPPAPPASLGSDPIVAQLREDVASVARMVETIGSRTAAPVDTPALASRLDALGERIEGLRRSGASEAAIRSVENHVAEMVRSIGDGTHREVATIFAELGSITAKLDQIAGQLAAQLAAPVPGAAAFDEALRDLRADMAALSHSVSAGRDEAVASLEARIDAVGERIVDLRGEGSEGATLQHVERHLADLVRGVAELAPRDADGLAEDLHAIEAKIDAVAAQGIDPAAMHRLNEQTGAIHSLLATQARRPDMLEALTGRIEALAAQVEGLEAVLSRSQAGPSNASLEAMIQQLVGRLEAAQHPDADERSFDALERQISRIAEKLDGADTDSLALSSIERTLSDLFGQLERTREEAIDAADGAAMRAVREAMAQFPATTLDGSVAESMKRHLDDIRSTQDQAGRKTQLTLEAVHATLERLADRMNQVETDLDTTRITPDSFGALTSASFTAPPPEAAPAAMPAMGGPIQAAPAMSAGARFEPQRSIPDPSRPAADERIGQDRPAPQPPMPRATGFPPSALDLGGDIPLEPGLGSPRGGANRAPGEMSAGKAMLAAANNGDKRANFIAAARRAVLAASNEASLPSESGLTAAKPDRVEPTIETQPRSDVHPEGAAEPRPRSRMRGLYAKRKRPILLGLAAVAVALGTIQVAKLAAPNPDDMAAPAASVEATPSPEPAGGGTASIPADPTLPPAPGSIAAPKPQSELFAPAGKVPGLEPAATGPVASTPASPDPTTAGPARIAGVPEAPAPVSTGSIGGGVPSFSTGLAGPQSPDDAPSQKLQDAVKAGDPRALYDMASRIADSRNPQRDLAAAAGLYQRASDKGFAPASYRLGSMYEKGIGVPKDISKARGLYERAADKGNVKSMHNMAVLYAEGAITGKPDYASAAQWFHLAAEHGLRDSEYNYAILVARGLGPAVDLPEAYKWFSLAADQGDQDAGSKRDEIGAKLDSAVVAKAKEAAAAFAPKSASPLANDATLPAVSWAEVPQGGA